MLNHTHKNIHTKGGSQNCIVKTIRICEKYVFSMFYASINVMNQTFLLLIFLLKYIKYSLLYKVAFNIAYISVDAYGRI